MDDLPDNNLIFIVIAAAALVALAVILFRRVTNRPAYIPDMRLSRRGKWLLAIFILTLFVFPIWQHYVLYR
jgi:hypothetical protein